MDVYLTNHERRLADSKYFSEMSIIKNYRDSNKKRLSLQITERESNYEDNKQRNLKLINLGREISGKDLFETYEEYLEVVLGLSTNLKNEKSDTEEQYSEIFDDAYEDIEQPNFNEYIPTTSEPAPPPTLIYEDQESIVEITPDQALYGSSVEIQLQDGTLVEVLTPPFAGDGWRLRIEGAAIGCRDHFVQLKVQTEDGLRIDGLRVTYRLELFPHDALLGCAVDIPTLNGSVTLQVPPNSSTGRLLRLRGRGLEYEEYRGDQIVEIIIVLPDNLSDSELALYQRLNEISMENY